MPWLSLLQDLGYPGQQAQYDYEAATFLDYRTDLKLWPWAAAEHENDLYNYERGGLNDDAASCVNAWKQTLDWFRTYTPDTKIVLSPAEPDGRNDWYQSPVTMTFNAEAYFSGMNTTKLRVDMGPFTTDYALSRGEMVKTPLHVYKEPITIDKDGEWAITYKSADSQLNYEVPYQETIKIKLNSSDNHLSCSRITQRSGLVQHRCASPLHMFRFGLGHSGWYLPGRPS